MNNETRKKLAINAISKALRCRIQCNIPPIAPVDPFALAEARNCEVVFSRISSLEGMYSTLPRATIIIGSQRPIGRRRFTCAHELGHHEFKHGMKLDELTCNKDVQKPEEFVADIFASHLLMPQLAVINTLKKRKWDTAHLTPEQIYKLAAYFGVGYSTIIHHLAWSLNLLGRNEAENLLGTSPKEIKASFDTLPNQEVVFADSFWQHRPISLEVGDSLVFSSDIEIEQGEQIYFSGTKEKYSIWKASSPGYCRAYDKKSEWAINIRVSRKNYDGFARYRFYKEI